MISLTEGNRRLTPLVFRPATQPVIRQQLPPPPPLPDRRGVLPPPPPLAFLHNTNAPLSGKLIREVAKIYTKEQKYDGSNSSFNHKLTIFHDICQRVKLPQDALI